MNVYSKFETELTVRPDDIDLYQHVHSTRYLDYVLAARFDMFDADGAPVEFSDLPALRLLAGLDAPPLLTRSVHRESGRELWLLTKATLLDDGGERLAVNIIEDVTGSRAQ